ncbi:MAG: hypothetical protein ABI760_05125 [Ferruginibacter sp.]
MKTNILGIALAFMIALSSCSKKDSNNNAITTTTVNTTVSSGTWRVTYFLNTNIDETVNFSGYNFTFATGSVLTAVNGANTSTGSWATGNDDTKVKLVLLFSTPGNFAHLNEDWQVTERTDSRIKLQHISGGGGVTDFLTFEKN